MRSWPRRANSLIDKPKSHTHPGYKSDNHPMVYELTYLINGIIGDEKLTTIAKNAAELVTRSGGKITPIQKDISVKIEEEMTRFQEQNQNQNQTIQLTGINPDIAIIKRRLAYPVKHKRQGYYLTINFTMEKPSEKLLELEKELKLEEEILRHIVLKRLHKPVRVKPAKAKKEKAIKEETPTSETPLPEKPVAKKSEDKKLDELEKKLDKILNI